VSNKFFTYLLTYLIQKLSPSSESRDPHTGPMTSTS